MNEEATFEESLCPDTLAGESYLPLRDHLWNEFLPLLKQLF